MVWCWWCCHPFDEEALRLPFKYDSRTKKFETMGHFCSWGCMKAFNIDRYGDNKAGLIGANILLLRQKMYGPGHLGPIASAPNRFALSVFGGTMTIEEFRSYGDSCRDTVISLPDEIKRFQSVEKPKYVESIPVIKEDNNKIYDIINSTVSGETLKLKRPKPLKRDENNLEKTLGIKKKTVKVNHG